MVEFVEEEVLLMMSMVGGDVKVLWTERRLLTATSSSPKFCSSFVSWPSSRLSKIWPCLISAVPSILLLLLSFLLVRVYSWMPPLLCIAALFI